MADSPADQDLADRYRDYIAVCNARQFNRLGEFVAPQVRVNDVPTTLAAYAGDLAAVVASFPDYRWDVRHLVVNRPWLCAHLIDTGTHTGTPFLDREANGSWMEVQEIAVYAYAGGLISEVWTTTDRLDALRQLAD